MLHLVADNLEVGVIVVDTVGKIMVYNTVARHIFGIDPRVGPGHPPGRLMPGDLVLIADTGLGMDDGDLKPGDLTAMGIGPSYLEKGDAFLAASEYGSTSASVHIERMPTPQKKNLKLRCVWQGKEIFMQLDPDRRFLDIVVGETHYPFKYKVAAGHMVIIDGCTKEVKFYQALGYTARREAIRDILKGKNYVAKGPTAKLPDLTGKQLVDIHPDNDEINQLIDHLLTKAEFNSLMEYELNGIPVRCRIRTLKKASNIVGGLLLVEDLTELKNLSQERDRALTALRNLELRFGSGYEKTEQFKTIIGNNKELLQVIQMAERAARSNATILLLGERGTGKSLFARAIHNASLFSRGPFVTVDCAGIPETLLAGELFGSQEGLAGDKNTVKPSKLEAAAGGTLFLKGIGDLTPALQDRLLSVLKERVVHRVGSMKPNKLDMRIIAASNKNLEDAICRREFREDLYFHLNMIPLLMPPLRKRKDDIAELVNYLLAKLNNKAGKMVMQISDEAMRLFMAYDWPGNVYELAKVLERGINLAEGSIILSYYLPPKLHREEKLVMEFEKEPSALDAISDRAERDAIVEVLKKTGGNKTKAARLLKIARTTLYNKIERYGIREPS